MELRLKWGDAHHIVDCAKEGEQLRLLVGDSKPVVFSAESNNGDTLLLRIDGRLFRARYARRGPDLYLQIGEQTALIHLLDEEEDDEPLTGQGSPVVRAPMPGKVLEILVEAGQVVTAGQAVIRVEAMKMEVELHATVDGVVQTVHAEVGELVMPDAPLVTVSEE